MGPFCYPVRVDGEGGALLPVMQSQLASIILIAGSVLELIRRESDTWDLSGRTHWQRTRHRSPSAGQ
jgi:hypothetical protein